MDLTIFVKISQTFTCLVDKRSDNCLIVYTTIIAKRLSLILHNILERSCIDDRHNNPQILMIYEGNILCYDIFMSRQAHNVDLLSNVLNVFTRELFKIYNFYGYLSFLMVTL